MSARVVHDSYTRTLKSGETKTYYRTYTYVAKTDTKHVGKLPCYNKITTCTEAEQMQKLLAFMDEIGI
jgi:hypothetical protein